MLKNKRIFLIPIVGFISIIFIGAILLKLPISTTEKITFKDALFTATSSVCVNGLVTVNIANTFTFFGQIIIATITNIGAIGFITFILYLMSLRNKKMPLSKTLLISSILNTNDYHNLKQKMKEVMKYTIRIEAIGAIFLSIKLIPIYGLKKGVWCSIFHSITAFCNAGLDIFGGSSLMDFKNDIYINIVLILLMISGGIGFFVIEDIIKCLKKKNFNNMQFYSKIILSTTMLIFGISIILIRILEPNLSWTQVLFMSVTPRTTGFYTTNISEYNVITKILTIMLMFIGGAPGSTSGGIRVVAFAVIVLTTIDTLKSKNEVVVFYKKINLLTIRQAITNITLSIIIVLVGWISLIFIENVGTLNLLFTTVSASSATGLTLVDIGSLNINSQYIIMLLMFIGRIGPVSAISVFTRIKKEKSDVEYVSGNLVI